MSRSSPANRASALWSGFQESGDPALLNQAASLLRAALGDEQNLRKRTSIMSNLAAVLQARSDITNDAEALRESIDLLQRALASTAETDPLRYALVLNLAAGLRGRYALTGDTDALLGCIALVRPEVERRSEPTAQAAMMDLLGATLVELYLAGGDVQELYEAVAAARIAVNLTPGEEVHLPSRLTTLAGALSARFQATQDMADLDAAITAARRALTLTASQPQAVDLAANLGALLHSRFELTGSSADLHEAIALTSDAVMSATRPRAATLRNLGAALLSRFERSGDLRDIDEAIAVYKRAVETVPPESGVSSDYLADLGRCLSRRYRIAGHSSDILEAITAIEEAVLRAPAEHPRLAHYLSMLAEARFLRYGRESDEGAAAMAVIDWQQAASVVGAGSSVRLSAARSWAETAVALGDWASAAAGYETAIGLLPVLLWRSTDQVDRSALHDKLADLPCDAAACMIQTGRPERALELLELGRGVLWRWLLGAPTELDALGQVAPDLAEVAAVLARIRNEIDHTGVPLVHARRGSAQNVVDRRTALAREWDELVARVRSHPGLEDFLRSPRAERLLAAGADGPVVVVNTSRYRCDALVLRPGGISVVPLPALSHDEAVGRLNDYLSSVSKLGEAASVNDSLYRERDLSDLLAWLWHSIAAPVLDHLSPVPGERGSTGRLPHIWWCPTGPLALLPLHAAGLVGPDGSLRGVLDHAVPSYTVTVSHLANAQFSAANAGHGGATDGRPLLVSLAATPGMPGLPTASREMQIVARSAARLRPTILSGAAATTESVRELLPDTSWVHFSCHGAAEIDEPWHSGIQLYDRRLTLTDLATRQRPAMQTVILSSCDTTAAGKRIADESVNLVAALQYIGSQQVVGALWSVRDESAAVMADHLYRDLGNVSADTAGRAARHLHDAVIELRRASPHAPSVWACFVHYGPGSDRPIRQ